MLSTNDMRALELLCQGGRWSAGEIEAQLRGTIAGAKPAMARLPGLVNRGLADVEADGYGVTPDGLTAYSRAVTAAYGPFASLPAVQP